jgi:hypothetical protein
LFPARMTPNRPAFVKSQRSMLHRQRAKLRQVCFSGPAGPEASMNRILACPTTDPTRTDGECAIIFNPGSFLSMRRLFKACPMRALRSHLPRERHLRFMLKRVALLGFLAVLIVANLSVSANAGRGDHDSGFSRSRDGRFGDHGRFGGHGGYGGYGGGGGYGGCGGFGGCGW